MSDILPPQLAYAELGRISLADNSLETVMEKIAALAKRTVPGASEVSVTLVDGGHPTTVASTGALASDLDERQYELGAGPCLAAVEGAEAILINDLDDESRWPQWAADAAGRGAHSSLSIPVPVQREVAAGLNLYSTELGAFDEQSVEVATTFGAYAGVALANMHLYQAQGQVAEQLQTAMRSRAVIEQAKGILMAAHRCGPDEAFDRLARMSQESNRKLRDIAEVVVDEATGGVR